MKKLIFIFSLILLCSCTTTTTEEEIEDPVNNEDRVVKMELNTTELTLDEIRISYFDYVTNTYPIVIHNFEYDSTGQPIPFVITLDNYDFRYINGKAYRNNSNTEEVSLKIYIDDELILEKTARGENGEYAEIEFNYDINLMSEI